MFGKKIGKFFSGIWDFLTFSYWEEDFSGGWLTQEEYDTLTPEEIEKREQEVIAELREKIKKL